jgi:uncharacterized protein YprB with RNaseH-like and TPR domain
MGTAVSGELHGLLKGLTKQEILRYSKQRCKHGHNLLEHPKCLAVAMGKKERIGVFDIESTALNASFGFMLCYAFKELGTGKEICRSVSPADIKAGRFDGELVKKLVVDLKEFDRVVTFNGEWFDMPFVRTRAMFHKVDFPAFGELKHTDLYRIARKKVKTHSRRLEVLCEFFGIVAKEHKFTPAVWMRALAGDAGALKYARVHCLEDVRSTAELYDRLIPFAFDGKKSI